MTAPPVRPVAAGLVVAAALAAGAGGADAQEPEGEGERSCRLVLEPTTDSTESVSLEVEPDTYVTHVRGGLRWTCGTARMVADSAVRYERDDRLDMIGSVDYADSVRTLLADRVTYHEGEDRIVAESDVRLTRRSTGSRLEGPRVEFLRVSGEEVRRTVATERPRMWLRRDTASADTAPPVRIDGDRIVLVGDEEARVDGDVVIRRRDMEARSDSAVFRPEEETGVLRGSPEVTGETWRLTGRTIRMRFEDDELREVVTEEDGHAVGDDFELFAPRIRARMADESVDRIWAYGEERPVAFSPPYRLTADSLEFVFAAGEIDRVEAVRDAESVEVGEERPEDPRASFPLTAGDRSWVAADTVTLTFASASPGADSVAPPSRGPGGGPALRGPGADARDRDTGVSPPPGDHAVKALPPVDALVDVTGGAGEDDAGEGDVAAADTADLAGSDRDPDEEERQIETVRAVGDARAYHLLASEEPGGRPGKHYQRGRAIVIHFESGEAVRLEGTDAVGVHLDPTGDGGPARREAAPGRPDTAPGDTLDPGPPPPDTAAADSAPPDTTPADTTADESPPPDSARAAPAGGGDDAGATVPAAGGATPIRGLAREEPS